MGGRDGAPAMPGAAGRRHRRGVGGGERHPRGAAGAGRRRGAGGWSTCRWSRRRRRSRRCTSGRPARASRPAGGAGRARRRAALLRALPHGGRPLAGGGRARAEVLRGALRAARPRGPHRRGVRRRARRRSGCGRLLARIFAGAPLATWQERLAGLDACVEPVLLPDEVCGDAHLRVAGAVSPARRAGDTAPPRAAGGRARPGPRRAHPGGPRGGRAHARPRSTPWAEARPPTGMDGSIRRLRDVVSAARRRQSS